MMQTQKQTQQIPQEEFLCPLSEDQLESITGGAPPFMPFPGPHILSSKELDTIKQQLVTRPRRPNPLNIAQFGRKIASTEF